MKPDVERAREMYGRRAATYDREVRRADSTRRMTVARLQLRPGDVVLDVGCGTGLSFPFIEENIGPEGRIIGVEASPEMLAKAQERVEQHGWQNVTLVEAPAEEAKLPELPGAVFFHFVHDITRSPAAIENVFRRVKPGARVAVAGGKWSRWWALPVNAYMWWLARRYVTTFEGFGRPWSHIERFVPDLRVEPVLFGAAYVAWGSVAGGEAAKEGPQ